MPPWLHQTPAELRRFAVTLLLAAACGGAAALAGLPAPWLSGAMLGAAIGVALKVDLHVPPVLRDVVFFVLGLSMGASVHPGTFNDIARWPLSIAALVATVAFIMAAVIWTLMRFGWDKETSLYASAPGALSTVLILASQSGANMPRVVVSQSLRIFVLVAVLPSIVVLIDPSAASGPLWQAPVHGGPGLLGGMLDVPIIITTGAVGAVICRLLKTPALYLFGAFIGSAVVHGAGLVTAPVPSAILIPSFVVLGAFIALRFKGTTWASLKDDLAASVAALVVGTVVAGIGAYLVHALLGIGLAEAMVAFAPGGLEAMIIMALALKLDVAYVSLHHLTRFLGIAVTLPLIVHVVIGRKAPPTGT